MTSRALDDTRIWLEKAVIGLNLCPFAKAVHTKGQVRWVLCEATGPAELLVALTEELSYLQSADPERIDTTLIVHPHVLLDFLDFNHFLGVAEERLVELGLEGEIQLASFHPRWQFAGTRPNDIGNHSNRSPHPTLHLLRESSVSRAVDAVPDAHTIPDRNLRTLQRLGHAGWRALGLPASAPENTKP